MRGEDDRLRPGDAGGSMWVASILIGEAVVRLVGGPDDGGVCVFVLGVVDGTGVTDDSSFEDGFNVWLPSSVFFLPNPNNVLFFFLGSMSSSAVASVVAIARGVTPPLPFCASSRGSARRGIGAAWPLCSGVVEARLIVPAAGSNNEIVLFVGLSQP
jgi:hypothetical protein